MKGTSANIWPPQGVGLTAGALVGAMVDGACVAAAVGDLGAVAAAVGLPAVGDTGALGVADGGPGGVGVSVGSFVGLAVAGFVGSTVATPVLVAVGVLTPALSPPCWLRNSANAPPAATASRTIPATIAIIGPTLCPPRFLGGGPKSLTFDLEVCRTRLADCVSSARGARPGGAMTGGTTPDAGRGTDRIADANWPPV